MEKNNYFDTDNAFKPYTISSDFAPGSLPPVNALRGQVPEIIQGFWPCEENGEWKQIEDHRGREGFLDGKRHTITTIGPLPENWSDVAPEKTLDEVKNNKLSEIMNGYIAAFAPIEAIYPATEREGWPMQEAEAKAVLVDSSAVTPVLSTLVQLRARGETVADLAQNVIAHAQAYRMLYAYLTGQQQRMYGEVSGLNSMEEIQAYSVIYNMPEGI